MMKDGGEVYLTSVIDTLKISPGVTDIPSFKKVAYVFLDELLRLQLHGEVDSEN